MNTPIPLFLLSEARMLYVQVVVCQRRAGKLALLPGATTAPSAYIPSVGPGVGTSGGGEGRTAHEGSCEDLICRPQL
eukprot:CAMPEP_0117677502 /NCGR_PEP_ID=MMETSP0804-20121206/16780_1 /TAXON_ID=1074897 /ORGANISM="Tetraselmis astigmatica, Strain CCMP880" /LENGTH=76 /DNA_ID=CAMNT_0005486791 /DNA_START=221 /DNA_END=451 /DNA_ORIENTATION=+